MNARLMELIDVSTIETMAEQFYKLTNISHQLLDAEKECIFSFGINVYIFHDNCENFMNFIFFVFLYY